MIKILHLTTDSKIAGAEKLLIGIAKEFDRKKFEIYFCTIKERGDLQNELEKLGQEALSLDCSSFAQLPTAYLKLSNIVKKYKINILHTHLYHASIIGQEVAHSQKNVVGIITRHYSDLLYIYGSAMQRKLDRKASSRAKNIIAISNGVKKVLVEQDKIDEKKITVIHNGIDFNEFRIKDNSIDIRKDLLLDKETKIIGAIGSLHPRKGHRYLIEAADILCRKIFNIKFIIAGEGVLEKELVDLRDAFGLEDKIIFTGFRKDVVDVIQAMDVIVQPSIEEGFGLSIIEAMSLGKPVIASCVGGIPEIIDDKKTGILVQSKNPIALAEAIEFFLNNKKEADLICKTAQEKVRRKFDLIKMIRRYEELYESCF